MFTPLEFTLGCLLCFIVGVFVGVILTGVILNQS